MAPTPGTSNNPAGENGLYEHLGSVVGGVMIEAQYGSLKRLKQQTRAAPIAQPGIAAPKRAQRASQRTVQQRLAQRAAMTQPAPVAPAPVAPAPMPTMELSYAARLAGWSKAIAEIPGASDEVKEYASRARAALNR